MTSQLAVFIFIGAMMHGADTFCPDGFPCSCESRGDTFRSINCIGKQLKTMPDFSGVDRNVTIQRINLMNNEISKVPNRTFHGLPALSIILDNNPITDLSPDAFKGVMGLTTLSLSNCTLKTCPILRSMDLASLTSLTLAANKISTIADDVFADPPPLKLLNLRKNQLQLADASENTFSKLGSTLERLDLSDTGMEEIPQKVFAPLQKLRVIKLQDNMLGSVDAIATAKYTGAKSLSSAYDFKNNKLQAISPEVFLNRPTPTTIDVSNNNITNLGFLSNHCFFEGAEVIAYGNPIDCGCDLYDILKAKTLAVLGECASPPEYKSVKLPPVYADGFFLQAALAKCNGTEAQYSRFDCTCDTWRNFTTFQEDRGKCVSLGSSASRPYWLMTATTIFIALLLRLK